MGNGIDVSALKISPEGLLRGKPRHQPAILLACAGGLTIAAAFAGMILAAPSAAPGGKFHVPEPGLYVLLGLMSLALALSAAAITRPTPPDGAMLPPPGGTRRLWLIFSALILIHCSLALLTLKFGVAAHIDTYTFQRDAAKSLLHGVNPYGTTQADIYDPPHTAIYYGPGMVVGGRVQVGFPYTPLTLLWTLPGYACGDVRLSSLFAVIAAAWLLFAIRPDARGLWIVSALLFSPLTLSVERLCWTEPLVLMTLSATVYAAVKKRGWLPLALGLFLAAKQYDVLALPLLGYLIFPFRWKAYWRLAGQSLAVAAATAVPFAFWNFQGLWHDLVLFQLAQPFREDSLSFAVAFPSMMKIGPALVLIFIAWLIRRAGHGPVAAFAAAYGSALLLFVSTSKQAFANYYFLIGHAFLLAAAAMLRPGIDASRAEHGS